MRIVSLVVTHVDNYIKFYWFGFNPKIKLLVSFYNYKSPKEAKIFNPNGCFGDNQDVYV